jgi:hypothetical protein
MNPIQDVNKPAAKVAGIRDSRTPLNTGVLNGIYWKIIPSRIYVGYPDGWGIPRVRVAARRSPPSLPKLALVSLLGAIDK